MKRIIPVAVLAAVAAALLSQSPAASRFEAVWGLDALHAILSDEANVRIPIDEWQLEGFERDLVTEYRADSVRRTGPGGRIRAVVPVTGEYYPGFVFYDGAGAEQIELVINGRSLGTVLAGADDNRQKLFFLAERVRFSGGEAIELKALAPAGQYRTESLLLLARKPAARKPRYTISEVEARRLEGGEVSFTWITSWPAACTVEWSGPRSGSRKEAETANNHRLRLPDPAPGEAFRFRVTAQAPDSSLIASAWHTVERAPEMPAAGTAKRERIELRARDPLGRAQRSEGLWPLTSGIPFPKGVLASDAHLRLIDKQGREVPLQVRTLGRWDDRTVKWVLLDAQAPAAGGDYALEYGSEVRCAAVPSSLAVREGAEGVEVITGPLRAVVSRNRYGFPAELWFDENGDGRFEDAERVTGAEPGAFLLRDLAGNDYTSAARPEEVVVEEPGPLRAVIRVSGNHESARGRLFGYTLRLHFFAGQPYLRAAHTLVNNAEADEFTTIGSLTLRLPLAGRGLGEPLRLAQFHDDRYSLTQGGRTSQGQRADGVVRFRDGRRTVTLALRDFWQNYPKEVAVTREGFELALMPRLTPETYKEYKGRVDEHRLLYFFQEGGYKLRQGVSKTHDLWLALGAGDREVDPPLTPLRLVAPADWYARSKALGELAPVTKAGIPADYDAAFATSFGNYLAMREKNREYGMLNFGDWWGEREINWGNSEYDTQHALLLQFARTGDLRYFRAAEEMEWHNRDVDTVHHHRDPRRIGGVYLHCVGHTGDYYPASPVPGKGINEGRFSISHTFIEGHLDYYFLTGDRRSLETALRTADRHNTLETRNYDFTNCRNPGWHLILAMAAYNATGDPFHLNASRFIVERVLERQTEDGGWRRQLVPGHCHCLPRHHGEAGFMVGILLTGLRYFYEATGDERVARSIERGAHYLIDDMWVPEVNGFRYTSCPRTNAGAWSNFLLFDGIVFAHPRTGDAKLGEVLRRGTPAAIKTMQGWGKGFTQYTRVAPHFLGYLDGLLRAERAAR